MCVEVTCRQCGRASWKGCGKHVDQVLGHVAREDRCQVPVPPWHSDDAEVGSDVDCSGEGAVGVKADRSYRWSLGHATLRSTSFSDLCLREAYP